MGAICQNFISVNLLDFKINSLAKNDNLINLDMCYSTHVPFYCSQRGHTHHNS